MRVTRTAAAIGAAALPAASAGAQAPAAAAGASAAPSPNDWPSYNRTPTGERFSALAEIDRGNVGRLRVLCTYDTGQEAGFQSGLVEVDGMLIGTTEHDTFAVDPDRCAERWRVHEDFTPANQLKVNRGVAYLDGRLFRGTADGRVLAYDARTGRRLWATTIADPGKGESVPAAPLAWRAADSTALVFVGNAGGDTKGVKGRVYALDAPTGAIRWEQYMVPRGLADSARGPAAPAPPGAASWRNRPGIPITGGGNWTSYTLDSAAGTLYVPGGNPAPDFVPGVRDGDNLYTGAVVALDARTGAYRTHYQLVAGDDGHDWDVASAPVLTTTRGGVRLLAATPKDGHLYGYDVATGRRLYRTPVTTILNATVPPGPGLTRFCPGTQGGAEWNGPAYDPTRDVLYTGQVDWCTRARPASATALRATPTAKPWSGMASADPKENFGRFDPPGQWAGRFAATDATTGRVRWRYRTPAPILSGVTPTAGGVVFFGDMGGTLYALDADRGTVLWSQPLGGAVGGGVITYATAAGQRVAAAVGMTSPIWPTAKVTAKVVVLGVDR